MSYQVTKAVIRLTLLSMALLLSSCDDNASSPAAASGDVQILPIPAQTQSEAEPEPEHCLSDSQIGNLIAELNAIKETNKSLEKIVGRKTKIELNKLIDNIDFTVKAEPVDAGNISASIINVERYIDVEIVSKIKKEDSERANKALAPLKIALQSLTATVKNFGLVNCTAASVENSANNPEDKNPLDIPLAQEVALNTKKIAALETSYNDLKKSGGGFLLAILVFIAFILTWVGMFFLYKFMQKNRPVNSPSPVKLSTRPDDKVLNTGLPDLELNDSYQQSQKTPIKSANDILAIKKILRQQRDKILSLESKLLELSRKKSASDQTAVTILPNNNLQDEGTDSLDWRWEEPSNRQHNTYFASAPDYDGCFDGKSFSEKMTNDVLYHILLSTDNNMVEFALINEPDIVKSATRYPENMLFRACESDEAFNRDASQIITVEKGIATKQGDKWQISKKAKVRYEI